MNEPGSEAVDGSERRIGSLADRSEKTGLPQIADNRFQRFVNFPSGDDGILSFRQKMRECRDWGID